MERGRLREGFNKGPLFISSNSLDKWVSACWLPHHILSPPAYQMPHMERRSLDNQGLSQHPLNRAKGHVGSALDSYHLLWTGNDVGKRWPRAVLTETVWETLFHISSLFRVQCCPFSLSRVAISPWDIFLLGASFPTAPQCLIGKCSDPLMSVLTGGSLLAMEVQLGCRSLDLGLPWGTCFSVP